MSRQILNSFRVYTGMYKIGDIRVPKLMRCHLKIQAINQILTVDAFLPKFRFELFLDRLTIHIPRKGPFFSAANLDIIPDPDKL